MIKYLGKSTNLNLGNRQFKMFCCAWLNLVEALVAIVTLGFISTWYFSLKTVGWKFKD